MSRLFDSHSHINAKEFDADRPLVIDRMRQAGLVGALVLGCDRSEIDGIKDLVHENPGFLYGAWALHPEYADVPETSVNEICDICSAPEITADGSGFSLVPRRFNLAKRAISDAYQSGENP